MYGPALPSEISEQIALEERVESSKKTKVLKSHDPYL